MNVPIAAGRRRSPFRARAALATGLLVALILGSGLGATVQAASTLGVGVGVGSGTVAGNVYAPGEVTVLTGDSVRFTIQSDEPHSVTFGTGPADVAPDEWPATGFAGTLPAPPTPASLTGSYSGSGFLNTGLLFKGSTATVAFPTAGNFGFLCQIHPGMAGTVHVVASGTTTTQAEADTKAQATRDAILGAVAGLEASTTAQVKQTSLGDGTSRWDIFTNSIQAPGPQPGGGIGFLELLRFVPPSLDIEAGDTVRWTSTAAHTVTFPAAGQDPMTIDPFTAPATTGTIYDGKSLYNSGFLVPGVPGYPSSYSLTFPTAGTFGYVCALHQFLGQVGSIRVAAVPTVTIPPTDLPPAGTGDPPEGTPWASIALLIAIGLAAGAFTLAYKRR